MTNIRISQQLSAGYNPDGTPGTITTGVAGPGPSDVQVAAAVQDYLSSATIAVDVPDNSTDTHHLFGPGATGTSAPYADLNIGDTDYNLRIAVSWGNDPANHLHRTPGNIILLPETGGAVQVTGDLTVSGAISTGDGNLALSGSLSAPTITASGALTGASVSSGSSGLTQLSADPAGTTGLNTTWARTDGGLYTRAGTAAISRLAENWGSGTTLPTGVLTGDTYTHTGVAATMVYDGTAWKQLTVGSIANTTARTTMSSTYSAVLHAGFRVFQTDIKVDWEWDGAAWTWAGGAPYVGKMWRTSSFSAALANGSYVVGMDAARVSTGFTFSSSANTLALPLDGLYLVTARSYLSGGGATGTGVSAVNRHRSGVSDIQTLRCVDQKLWSADATTTVSDILPLKAADTLSMTLDVTGSSGINYYGSSETFGCMLWAQWLSPLNGATAV